MFNLEEEPKSPDLHLDKVAELQGIKLRNPEWVRIFLMGYFTRSSTNNLVITHDLKDVFIPETAFDNAKNFSENTRKGGFH